MSNVDKAKNRVQEVKGQAKEQAGTITGDASKRRSGQRKTKAANLKQAGEKVKDAAR